MLVMPAHRRIRTVLLECGMYGVLQYFRDRKGSHNATVFVSDFDASCVHRNPLFHVLLNHIASTGLRFVKGVFQVKILGPFFVPHSPARISKVYKILSHTGENGMLGCRFLTAMGTS